MDEDQENVRAMKSDEEEDHKKDARKLVEMVQKEKAEQEGQWGRVAPDMGAGGSHPRQRRTHKKEGRRNERRKARVREAKRQRTVSNSTVKKRKRPDG